MARASATGDDRSGSPPGSDADLVFELHDKAQVDELSRALTSLLERTAMTARQVKEFRLAVLEMAGNAIEWGRGDGRGTWALVTCRVGRQDVTVIVRDRGPDFITVRPTECDQGTMRKIPVGSTSKSAAGATGASASCLPMVSGMSSPTTTGGTR
jgi:anti-sigma regulatory factor (Ser/Thr protein kinase)